MSAKYPSMTSGGILEKLRGKARQNCKHIVLPEGHDPRVLQAAVEIRRHNLARITVLGDEEAVRKAAAAAGIPAGEISAVSPVKSPDFEKAAQLMYDLRRAKGITPDEAHRLAANPMYFANLMVRSGAADGSVGGATTTTADTVRAAIQVIGLRQGFSLASSFFIMELPNRPAGSDGVLFFSDCGVVVDPNPSQLAEIAVAAADNFRALTGEEPRVALLSFSTKGSAHHAMQAKVAEAARTVQSRRPELACDGELQADAALVEAVANSKAPGSKVAGKANVLIFPNLDAGNIGYKLVERLAGATAIGPILQGLDKPSNDLSRGCKAQDIVDAVVITSVQAQARETVGR